ncbi:NAD(P)/FAD-dependent oxidoreductase [Allostreptomyces psammosilenae]|uniref:NADPH-dependent 2,4-dienoyl-CoA reductase/sulfur reductase-like enzyme n=1 Tax=Allostreptomyces psammosilenae TaxID=1892865 RepID=A0A853A1J4_9ACTN|nr:FAD/NAD(P)-binding oxidoreductase [Allostreptomyces psammosilenae]NYI04278.1 NADPH-dependent 2,4-dienoyl-CoA reductase/sulfur reductase-like enzyme [Allostreptomyces psammosilenae]
MSTDVTDVLVVGASAGGLGVAEALRRRGHEGTIRLVGAETHPPYDRPPLSKQVLSGAWAPEKTHLRREADLEKLGLEFVLGRRAVGLDTGARAVHLDDGRRLGYRTLVVATGLAPRRLPFHEDLDGVHTLRTLDDSLALRRELLAARRLAVIGAGVLGCEIAATARGLGLDVTLIDPLPTPMARQLGEELGGMLAALHAEHGVRLRTGVGVAALTSEKGRVSGVRLGDGETVPAEVVVVTVGSTPGTGWLEGSGLPLEDGLVCDSRCRALPDVYAVGDVARWHDARLGGGVRLENRTNATEQALAVAANILGADRPYTPVPYFWTDQYDARIQVYGTIPADAGIRVVEGAPAAGRFVALASSGGKVTGAVGWNSPKGARLARQHVVQALEGAAG